MLIDTHCHIHSADYQLDPEEVIERAKVAGVEQLVCVGTDVVDSVRAVEFVAEREGCFASVGLHPHDAKLSDIEQQKLAPMATSDKVVAIGECGLDYFYNHSPKEDQIKALEFQMGLALENKLPMIFHVREAFDDFWPIFDAHPNLTGIIHSFSAGRAELDQVLQRGLYVGLNGIMVFTKNEDQLEAASRVPLDRLLLETDSPFLTPPPFRGKINQPKHVEIVARFLSELRGESFSELARATTENAKLLLKI